MSDSILQSEKKCYLTGTKYGLHKHHIFGAFNRDNSEKYGLWVWLAWDRHIANSPHETPHNNSHVDLMLKRQAQREFEKLYSHEKFIEVFGRNWLDD